MLRSTFTRLVFATAVMMMSVAGAQVGHPAKGSWVGHWGPDDSQQRRIILILDWRNGEVTGTINPGPRAVKVDKATIDYDTWTMTVEANLAPAADKPPQKWVATGKLENLGSWTNRHYSGTYRNGAEHGKFKVILQ
jgi:hypothetical protein